jgi:hypothetical protein
MTLFFAIELPNGDYRHETVELTSAQLAKLKLQPGEAVDEILLDEDDD